MTAAIAPQLDALTVPIDAVRPHPRNPNQGDVGSISTSLTQFSQYAPIVVQRSTGYIVKGNHTYLAAKALGWPTIAANVMDLDDTQALAILVGDNRHSELGTRDQDQLAALLTELAQGEALLGTGYDGDDVDALLAELNGPTVGLTDPDAVPAVPAVPITQPGDLWTLGRHRLLCGDSTVATDAERLMAGASAQMVFTDPPYNTGIQQGRTASAWGIIENDDLSPEQFYELLMETRGCVALANEGDIYLCCDHRSYTAVARSFGTPRSCIVWAKENFGLGVGYRRQHEFICYWGGFQGNTESDLWQHAKDRGSEYRHPTQKPTALAERAIGNSSKPGDIVLDLFGGSGSTLIAAEQTRRTAYLCEISPAYCDVIVARWEQFTGGKAVRGA